MRLLATGVLVVSVLGALTGRAQSACGLCNAPASVTAANPHWRLWPFGGAVVGGLVGLGAGVGIGAGWGALAQLQSGCDPERDDFCGALASAVLAGVPLGLFGALGLGIVGAVVGHQIAVGDEDEAQTEVGLPQQESCGLRQAVSGSNRK